MHQSSLYITSKLFKFSLRKFLGNERYFSKYLRILTNTKDAPSKAFSLSHILCYLQLPSRLKRRYYLAHKNRNFVCRSSFFRHVRELETGYIVNNWWINIFAQKVFAKSGIWARKEEFHYSARWAFNISVANNIHSQYSHWLDIRI